MEDKFIATSFGKLHAHVEGTGQPVLLIHGRDPSVNSWRTWEKNIHVLATRFCVYALDMLGYGESDKPTQEVGIREQAQAFVELRDADRLERVSLIGLSWGGALAQVVVALVPERVEKLVLVDSGYDESDAGIQRLNKIKCPTLIVWDEEDVVIPVKGAHWLAKAIPNSQLRILTRAERDGDADPNSRHWSQMTHSAVWNRTVLEFLVETKSVQ